jgi:hypothetical protein
MRALWYLVLSAMTTTRRRVLILASRNIFMKAKKLIELNLRFSNKTKFPISQSHGTKVSYAASRRMTEQHRILGFRWHPHATAGAVLKMHFIRGPQIYLVIPNQLLGFFTAFCRSRSA